MMFPGRPRPPMPPFQQNRPPSNPFFHGPYPPQPPQQTQQSNRPNFLALFQDENGQMDVEKLMGTAQQVGNLYSQVSPLISQFIKR